MEQFLSTALLASLSVGIFLLGVFIVSAVRRNNGFMDVAWGICFVLIALTSYFSSISLRENAIELNTLRATLVTSFVLLWGLRLAVRIYYKNRGKPEDFRYAKWRALWGRTFLLRSFFQIYVLQGLLALVVATPVLLVNTFSTGGLGFFDYLGISIWITGFFFEVVGDYQLDRFIKGTKTQDHNLFSLSSARKSNVSSDFSHSTSAIKNPKNRGRVMRYGLWRYSRHPNYFGESLMWWGLAFIAAAAPYGILAFLSPILITFLLLKVSGVPMLEKKFEGNAEWEEYRKQTSVFVPQFPKNV